MTVDISNFYGITTTTLVVLSSATLALFQYFLNSAKEDIETCGKKLASITNNKGKLNCGDDFDVKDDTLVMLTVKNDNVSNEQRDLSKVKLKIEIKLLLIVVLLAAISILLVLFSGLVPQEYALNYKVILALNLFSIILYIFTFLLFLYRFNEHQKRIDAHSLNVNDLVAMVDVAEQYSLEMKKLTSP